MHYLWRQKGRVIQYVELTERFRVSNETFKVNLSRIRAALKESQDKWAIKTVMGEGIIFKEIEVQAVMRVLTEAINK